MKIKLKELLEVRPSLVKLLSQPMPVKTAYWISKGVNKLNGEFKDFEARRLELVKEMGKPIKDKKGKDTGQIQVVAGKMPAFNKKLEQLTDIDIEVDIKPVSLKDLSKADMSPLELASLERFIKE